MLTASEERDYHYLLMIYPADLRSHLVSVKLRPQHRRNIETRVHYNSCNFSC